MANLLLLTGPPGSGKTHRVLERLRGSADARLLVPTATMAEHLRNQLARDGQLVRAESVQTLRQFVDALIESPPQASEAALGHVIRRALGAAAPAPLRDVAQMAGFQSAVARVMSELDSVPKTPDQVSTILRQNSIRSEHAGAVIEVAARVRDLLRQRGLGLRGDRLQAAERQIARDGLPSVRAVLLDGFFHFTLVELRLIRALASRAEVTVTLPDWSGSAPARRALRAMGFAEQAGQRQRPLPARALFRAPTAEKEAVELARRILREASAGRPFREMGIVVRGPSPYVPVLRHALGRFGIPAHFYFSEPVHFHPAAWRVVLLVSAVLGGFPHETLIEVLRLGPPSAELDRLEFRTLERLPGMGLDALATQAEEPAIRQFLDGLRSMEAWPGERAKPAEWASRIVALSTLFPPPDISDGVSHEQARLWRGYPAAVEQLREAVDEAAGVFVDQREIPLSEFWEEARRALGSAELRIPDHRRNVVHVMDVYEARQWELPVVFVCGLAEGEFPKHPQENPLLGDAVREALRKHGVYLPTSREKEAEEQFLFDLATTRATHSLTLSYPAFDERGDEIRPSSLLERYQEAAQLPVEAARPVRPAGVREPVALRAPAIRNTGLLDALAARHTRASATSIESFLECPFAFFAGHTLRLREMPPPASERLDALLAGSIAHRALAELYAGAAPAKDFDAVFERVFETSCAEAGVFDGYRKETARIEIGNNLRRFVRSNGLPLGDSRVAERRFTFPLAEALEVTGSIDRIERFAGNAVVIDYKYTRPERLSRYLRENSSGDRVQAGLYLLAVGSAVGEHVAGMLFCSLNGEPKWNGWHVVPSLAGLVKPVGEADLHHLMNTAAEVTQAVSERIRTGEIAPAPRDADRCSYCAAHNICRIETGALTSIAGGGRA